MIIKITKDMTKKKVSKKQTGSGVLADASSRLIDKVTVTNLDIALRMCNIQLDKTLIDRIIDIVELIEDKGDDTSIKDICQLQSEWSNGY